MVRTTSTRIVRAPFPSGHNLGSSAVCSTINSYVVGTPTTTAFISSPAGGRRNTSVSTYIPVQSQQTAGEESMSLIVQLGTAVVASTNSQIVSNTMTVAKAATGTVLTNRNVSFHDQRLVNKVSQQNNSSLRQSNPTSLSPVTKAHLQLPQQLMTKPTCIVEVQTPKPESVKEEARPAEESNSDDENIGEEKRPTYSGQLAMSYQFALQDHNYGAPPPVSPPPSPVTPHTKVSSSINGVSVGNTSATSSSTSYAYGSGHSSLRNSGAKKNGNDDDDDEDDDDANSIISSNPGREVEPEGEETETAPEGEGDDEDSVTRCICDFEHDDGYMICCDKCFVWQHVDCMGIDRSNIPEEYLCECCQPRRVDKQRARTLQMRKREELLNNDSSSDTSSTSSVDTDSSIINNPIHSVRKRSVAPSVARRKSDPVNTNRKNSVISSNASQAAKQRQRRDSSAMHRRSSVNQARKREPPSRVVEKRMPMRRKSKSRLSDDEKEDINPGVAMQQLRQWIDNYEEAVTNHYSPELRARLTSAKVNGTHADLKTSSIQNPGSAAKCKVVQSSSGVKILIATSVLSANSPVIEIRGKYMLSGQHKPITLTGMSTKRSRPPPPGPYLFFYRLPKDGTEVCVDARTYGNDARFVRRSCKPNAELKHCIEKGALHLYIVTLSSVDKNEEITISHFVSQEQGAQNHTRFNCACGNMKECAATTRKNGIHETFDRERRRRGRRAVSSEEDLSNQALTITSTQPDVSPGATIPLRRNSSSTRSPVKGQTTPPILEDNKDKNKEVEAVDLNEKADKKKMTREERKMEAIMKAFERLEKAEQRRQENQAKRKDHDVPRREISEVKKEEEKDFDQNVAVSKLPLERPRRRRKKGRRFSTTSQSSHSQSKRRTRRNSIDSDGSSGDEAGPEHHNSASPSSPPLPLTPSAPQKLLPQTTPVVSSSNTYTHSSAPAGNSSTDMSPASRLQTAAGLLLALSNPKVSDMPSSSYQTQGDTANTLPPPAPPSSASTPLSHGGVNPTLFSSVCDSASNTSSSSQGSTPPTPLSAACLMVAAAVGPLAPGFKFPKTKKVLMNEWLNKSPDLPSTIPSPTLPPTTSPVPQNKVPDAADDAYSYKSLATLAQAANSVGMGSPNQCPAGVGRSGAPGGSAKKRWLRQAISEECDSPNNNSCQSPNSRAGSPPCPDYVTPLKKRRLARESVSSERSFTPPTTPTLPSDGHHPGGSPLHRLSHFEMAANALGVPCDDDDEVDGSPDASGTPHTQDDEEEYEEIEMKGEIERGVNDHEYEDHPHTVTEINMGCPVQPACEEEACSPDRGNANQKHVDNEEVEHKGVSYEDEILRNKDGTSVSEALKLNGKETLLLKANVDCPQSTLGVGEKAFEERTMCVVKKQVESDSVNEAMNCDAFKTPDISEETVENFKKPADVDSGEHDPAIHKESPNAVDETSSALPPKRKLSISEYRQRKQRTSSCSEQPARSEEADSSSVTSPARIRNRSDSTSSSSSSISSDDARTNKILAETPASLATLPVFLHPENLEERKGSGEDVNYVRWNSAPTLVERQRENLTERLRREFGLFLSDDEEQERARKQGLGQEGAKDGKKKGPPPPPPPPPPLPPPDSTNPRMTCSVGGHIYTSPQKVHSGSVANYPIHNVNNSASASFTSSYLPTNTGSARTPVHNGPSYGTVYPVSGSLKGQLYQGFPGNPSGKCVNPAKGSKVPPYTPGSANSSNVSASQKTFYMPPNNTNCNVPYSVQSTYAPHSTILPPSQQGAIPSPRAVATPGSQSHYISANQTGSLQASSVNQPPPPTSTTATFYTVASAKAYYQTSTRP